MKYLYFLLALLFGAFSARASLPEFPAMEFDYACSFEVQIFEKGKGTFKNYEKQFTLKNNSDSLSDLFAFSSTSQGWSHYCENCSGAKKIYQGQEFASPVKVELIVTPASFGRVYATLMYTPPGDYSVETEVELLSESLPKESSRAFPEVKTKNQLLTSHLYCRTNLSN